MTAQLRILLPSATMMTPESWFKDMPPLIEHCGRVSHKSEPAMTEDSFNWFIPKITQQLGHQSITEHLGITVKILGSRAMSHQLVRHRIAAYTQECLAGDTYITKTKTIAQLYTQQLRRRTRLRLRSCTDEGTIIPNEVLRVFHKGRADVYRVCTRLGYSIKATINHEFMRSNGTFDVLEHLQVGDRVLVNGRPCLCKLSDTELSTAYLANALTPQEIADAVGAPYRSVIIRLQKLGIFAKHRNDKDKEKYNRNHTAESSRRLSQTLLRQYQSGERMPWNKGLNETSDVSVKRQADTLRQYHHNNGVEDSNSNWKGGISQPYYTRIVAEGVCSLCGRDCVTEIHHHDRNRRHNVQENLQRVCINCHDKLHCGWHVGKVAHADVITSITLCGQEDVYDLEMAVPYHNYVANGFVVHNSQRYCDYSNEKKTPAMCVIVPPSILGMVGPLDPEWHKMNGVLVMRDGPEGKLHYFREGFGSAPIYTDIDGGVQWTYFNALMVCYESYLFLRDKKIPPEDARFVLPNASKTEVATTYDIHEWRHVLKTRLDKHAQWEIRIIMAEILRMFLERVPVFFEDLRPLLDTV